MSDLNIDELIEKFGKNYPDWLNRSLGNQIASMDKTLKQIYGDIDDVEKNVGKLVKNSDKSLAEDKKTRDAIVKVNATLEKISKDKSVTDETKKVKTEISKLGKLLEKANTNDAGIKSEIEKLTKTVEKMNKKDDSSLEKTMKTSLGKLQKTLEKIAHARPSTDNTALKSSVDKLQKTMEKMANDKTSSTENAALKSEVIRLNATVKKLLTQNKDKTVEKSIRDSIESLKGVLPARSSAIADKGVQTSIDNLTKTIEEFIKTHKLSSVGGGSSGSPTSDVDEKMEELSDTIEKLTLKNKNLTDTLRKRHELDKEYNKSLRTLTSDISAMGKSLRNNDFVGIVDTLGNSLGRLASAVPVIGNVLGGLVGFSTTILTGLINEATRTQTAFAQLSRSGIVVREGFIGLRRAAAQGNMSMEELASAMSLNSRAFVALGVNAGSEFSRMAQSARGADSAFRRLGMTSDQINEFLSNNLEYQRLTGNLNRLTEAQRSQRANEEVVRLTRLSQAMGISSEALQRGSIQYAARNETQVIASLLDRYDSSGQASDRLMASRAALEASGMTGEALEAMSHAVATQIAREYGAVVPSSQYAESTAILQQQLGPEFFRIISHMNAESGDQLADLLASIERGRPGERGMSPLHIAAMNPDTVYGRVAQEVLAVGRQARTMGVNRPGRASQVESQTASPIDPVLGTLVQTEELARKVNAVMTELSTNMLTAQVTRDILSTLNTQLTNFTQHLNTVDFESGTLEEIIQQLFGLDGNNPWVDLFTHPDTLKAMALGIAGLWAAGAVIGALAGAITGAFAAAAVAATGAAAMRGLRGVFGGRGTQVPGTRPGPAGTAPRSTTIAPRPQSVPPAGTVPRTPTPPPASPPLRSPAPYGPTSPRPVSPWASPAAPVAPPVAPTGGPRATWISRLMRNPVVNTGSRILGPLTFALQGYLAYEEWKYYRDNPEALHDMIMEREGEDAFRENFDFHGDDVGTPTPNINPTLDTISPFFDQSIGDAEIDDIRRYLESIPEMATGGVAVQKTLVKIAEAGSPEMVLPLDPALHDMAKYIAEQHVEIAGPMYRRLNNELIYRLFRENDEPIDRTFTKSLNKFFFSKEDVERTLSDLQAFYNSDDYLEGRVTELPSNIRNALAIMNTMGLRPEDNYSRYTVGTNESGSSSGGYAGTGGTGGNINISSEDVYNDFMGVVRSEVQNPYALAAIAATGQHESSFSANRAFGTWADRSESGQQGTSGGIMSWREDRYRRMLEFTGGDLSPEQQARFFLAENPQLIAQLNAAQSVEDAARLMANAWRFAGYNRPGGEAQARLETARSYLQRFASEPSGEPASESDTELPSGFMMPTQGRISSRFGHRIHPISGDRRMHNGVDIAASTGTLVQATQAGEVEFAGMRGGYGNLIIINHPNGFQSRYGHLSEIERGIRAGVRVTQGQTIGRVGSTGNSTGPHLHFELLINGVPQNPLNYVSPDSSFPRPQIETNPTQTSVPSAGTTTSQSVGSYCNVSPNSGQRVSTDTTRSRTNGPQVGTSETGTAGSDDNTTPEDNGGYRLTQHDIDTYDFLVDARPNDIASEDELRRIAEVLDRRSDNALIERYGRINTLGFAGIGDQPYRVTETDIEQYDLWDILPGDILDPFNAQRINDHHLNRGRVDGRTEENLTDYPLTQEDIDLLGINIGEGELATEEDVRRLRELRASSGDDKPVGADNKNSSTNKRMDGIQRQLIETAERLVVPMEETTRRLEGPMREAAERLEGPMRDMARQFEGPMNQIGRQFETMFSGGFPLDFLPNNSNIMGHMSSFASEIQPLLQGAGSTLNNLTQDFGPIVDAVTSSMGRLSRDFRDSASETRLMSRGLIA
jgi:murein DD-endopeptidase MepM/ murein hydrolase activator NlpD